MRLIDADALLNFLEEHTDENDWCYSQYNADWIYSFIETAPTVDTERHGHWIKKEFIIFDDVYKKVQCSNCHTHWDVSFQYCPNCGAKMEVTDNG